MRFWKFASLSGVSRVLILLVLLAAFTVLGPACHSRDNASTASVRPLHFIVYGDTRDGHAVHRKLVALIMARHPDLVIQTGDLVHRGGQADLWKIYDDITGEMRRQIPVYPARGNHDFGGPGFEDRISERFPSGSKLFYSFEKANCHFAALAVDEYTPYGPGSAQYQWLEKDLAEARQKGRHIFVFFHVPPYSIGAHGSDLRVRRTLCPLFVKYRVCAVLNGHDHIYYHTLRDGVTYVVSGGGGAPLYPCNPNQGAIEGDKWESVNHIVDCVVEGDKVTMTAIRANDTPIERFTITAP